ncbi:MAG: hypothetical protein LBU97_04505 [Alistipes sp.]|jgi:hypothetical protein|nr:hypothetical protein [Alistipes sp.]
MRKSLGKRGAGLKKGLGKRSRALRRRLARAAVYSRTLVRVKHYRGRKVHSPFVYGIVRNAIMKTTPQGGDRTLFDGLRERGFSVKRAAQLQNLYTYRGYTSAVFAEGGDAPDGAALDAGTLCLGAGTLCFAMPTLPPEQTRALVERARGTGAAICVVAPYENRARLRLARELVEAHRHTSVDNRGFLLIFTDERLPKQHFKL